MSNIPCISIVGRRIASDTPPYIIAELSANHNGRLDTGMQIVEAEKKADVDAIKLQTYTPDTITPELRLRRVPDSRWHVGREDPLPAIPGSAHALGMAPAAIRACAQAGCHYSVRLFTTRPSICWKISTLRPTRLLPSRSTCL
ncbi:hypothetical protein [Pseudomonas lopnurensis]|uniref:hypothetical protein n=1 Tax=Pseudomonas lopnurensis TaxID=1477517 RepID=UPI003F68A06D